MNSEASNINKITAPNGNEYNYRVIEYPEWEDLTNRHGHERVKKYDKYFAECMSATTVQLGNGQLLLELGRLLLFESEDGYLAFLNQAGLFRDKKYISKAFPMKVIEYFPKRKKIVSFKVEEEYSELIKKFYPKVQVQNTNIYLYKINDKKFLYPNSPYNGSLVYSSLSEFGFALDRMNLFKRTSSEYRKKQLEKYEFDLWLMYGRNQYEDDFLDSKFSLIEKLPELLNTDQSIFNFKKSSLKVLEESYYSNVITSDFSDKIFLPLLAYIGEILVREKSAEWNLYYSEIYNSWIPDILQDGKLKKLWRPLLKITDPYDENWRTFYEAYNYKHR
jgi:hypothetical protein